MPRRRRSVPRVAGGFREGVAAFANWRVDSWQGGAPRCYFPGAVRGRRPCRGARHSPDAGVQRQRRHAAARAVGTWRRARRRGGAPGPGPGRLLPRGTPVQARARRMPESLGCYCDCCCAACVVVVAVAVAAAAAVAATVAGGGQRRRLSAPTFLCREPPCHWWRYAPRGLRSGPGSHHRRRWRPVARGVARTCWPAGRKPLYCRLAGQFIQFG